MSMNHRKSKPTITLVTDPFEIEAKLAPDGACGGWNQKFRAALEVTTSELDQEGFVVEARHLIQTIRDYFKNATYRASCEQLAQCAVNLICNLVGKDVLLRIKVQVFSLTGHIRMEWKAGDEVPDLPFCVERH
jgi:hypothetical protein